MRSLDSNMRMGHLMVGSADIGFSFEHNFTTNTSKGKHHQVGELKLQAAPVTLLKCLIPFLQEISFLRLFWMFSVSWCFVVVVVGFECLLWFLCGVCVYLGFVAVGFFPSWCSQVWLIII